MPSFNVGIKLGLIALVSTVVGFTRGDSDRPSQKPKVHDVQMVGDASGYKFSPATITVKRGDRVRWTMVSGAPHNVVFWADSIPKGAAAKLGANMPKPMSPLMGTMLMTKDEKYEVSFAGLPAGTYKYYCMPHLALGMTAVVRVE